MNKLEENFSVSISVYQNDSPAYFKEAVESILNQTLLPSEIVLLIDGPIPTDTQDIISYFKKKCNFLKVIKLDINLGHGNARRIGLNHCTNNIVALMDSDDICCDNRFELQFNFLINNKEISVVGGQIEEFEDNVNNIISKRIVPETNAEIMKFIKFRCPMNQMTVMFRKKQVLEAGGYLDWFCNEDYYLWIRMLLKKNNFHNLKETLVKVRVDLKMFDRRGGWKYFKSEYNIQKLLKSNKIITYYQFCFNIIIRFIIQVILPNKLRRILFLKLFRN